MHLHNEIDRSRTLTKLEKEDWGPPTYDSYLVRTVHALRYKPLRDFTVEDLCIIIGQSFSLPFLIPLAIEQLRENVLSEGGSYTGNLLMAVLASEATFWRGHPDLWREMLGVIDQLPAVSEDRSDDLAFLEPDLSFLIARFRGLQSADGVDDEMM